MTSLFISQRPIFLQFRLAVPIDKDILIPYDNLRIISSVLGFYG